MDIKRKIVNISIDHWIKEHGGISAITLANILSQPHEKILKILSELELEGIGSLRKNVVLSQYTIPLQKGKGNIPVKEKELKKIVTSFFYPSKKILAEYVQKNMELFTKDGEYLMKLHLGGIQIDLCYFEIDVLKKYLDNTAVYYVHDDLTGGYITLNSEYSQSLKEEDYKEKAFAQIRYGKRILSDGRVVVAAILHDLAELPLKEQKYWASFDSDAKNFSRFDPHFETFLRRGFAGEFLDSHDPIEMIVTTIKNINSLFKERNLFRHDTNPDLHHPVINTEKEFNQSLKELYKLISNDNLDIITLKQFLQQYLGLKNEDFIHKESNKPLSQNQLLKFLFRGYPKELVDIFDSIIEQIREGRIIDAHLIKKTKSKQKNYPELFKMIAYDLHHYLTQLEDQIRIFIELKDKEKQ